MEAASDQGTLKCPKCRYECDGKEVTECLFLTFEVMDRASTRKSIVKITTVVTVFGDSLVAIVGGKSEISSDIAFTNASRIIGHLCFFKIGKYCCDERTRKLIPAIRFSDSIFTCHDSFLPRFSFEITSDYLLTLKSKIDHLEVIEWDLIDSKGELLEVEIPDDVFELSKILEDLKIFGSQLPQDDLQYKV